MQTKQGTVFSPATDELYKKTLINMIYKLLPLREEKSNWQLYLDNCIAELQGFHNLFSFDGEDEIKLIRILSKLEGLRNLEQDEDFYLYRKIVLDCLNLID